MDFRFLINPLERNPLVPPFEKNACRGDYNKGEIISSTFGEPFNGELRIERIMSSCFHRERSGRSLKFYRICFHMYLAQEVIAVLFLRFQGKEIWPRE